MSKSDPKKLELSIEEQKTYNSMLSAIAEAKTMERTAAISRLQEFVIALQIKNGWLVPEKYEEAL